MSLPSTNLQVLRPSRSKPKAGDIFVLRLPDLTHLFGRVVEADINDPQRAPMPGAYLIYVYNYRSPTMDPDMSRLVPDHLLIPPIFINRMPWTRGYFETIAHIDLLPQDKLAAVSYWDAARERFVDQDGKTLSREIHPCGEWGLASYRVLDALISDALGIPSAAEGS